MFAILKIFFFRDFLNSNYETDKEKSEHVVNELINKIPEIGYLPEGIHAAKRIHELSKQYKLKLPISRGVYRILNCETEPIKEVELIISSIIKATKVY